MAYADYEFYVNKYYGSVISEDAFARLEAKASEKLDYLSNYRVPRYIESIVVDDTRDEVLKALIAKATCWLAEEIMKIEELEKLQSSLCQMGSNGAHSNVITSISSGGESVSYANPSSVQSLSYIGDKKKTNAYLYDGIREYLGGSGLLSQVL
jgi:hypothetical protein